jgi:trehalose/maltose hydrolase-like predicted phosphorylase
MVRWAKKAEVTHEGMAKAAGIDKSEAEHHLGAAVAYARCARKIGSEDRG